MPLEEISRLVGHSETAVIEEVYRKQIRPVIQTGAVVMDGIFKRASERHHSAGGIVTQIDTHAETGEAPTESGRRLTCCFNCRGGGI